MGRQTPLASAWGTGLAANHAPEKTLAHEGYPKHRADVFKEKSQFVREARGSSLDFTFGDVGFRKVVPSPRLAQFKPFALCTSEPDTDYAFFQAFLFPTTTSPSLMYRTRVGLIFFRTRGDFVNIFSSFHISTPIKVDHYPFFRRCPNLLRID